MKKIYFLFLIGFVLSLGTSADAKENAQSRILAGPMLGYSEHRESLIWLQTKCASKVSIQYFLKENPKQIYTITKEYPEGKNCRPLISKIVLESLEPNSKYFYKVLLDNKPQTFPYELTFKTKSLKDIQDFSFLVGSCAFIADPPYDRDPTYGQGTQIFKTLGEISADFMLWLGDTVYLQPADYSSVSGIKYRYAKQRSEADLQKIFAKYNHYAIWDDHDFGPNDSNKTYELKDATREEFTTYWGNKTYGENNEGIYSKFSYYDAEFFLLDDRSFRDEDLLDESLFPEKSQLGAKQKEWIKNSLAGSKATFKFVAVGGQFLNENTDKESFNYFKNERNELLDFIAKQKIKGVVFLTGDRHHTELLKVKDPNINYPLYELTSSAFSSHPSKILNTPEKDNPQRIPNTLLVEPNYCKVSVLGSETNRRAQLECFNKTDELKWKQVIYAKEIQ